ncbi:MAG: DUF2167 domain-containing protein [Bacteroidetes bacterium]|nr:DUF2167 domain-containing protein [Bacteroidota bacterium]
MKKITFFLGALFCANTLLVATGDSTDILVKKQLEYVDSVNKALKWQTDAVTLQGGAITLNISKKFKFLNAEQSHFVLHDIWGNPPRPDVIGMIFPAGGGPFTDSSFAFIVTYEEMGFVKDDDAEKIDYTEMMENIKKAEPEENKKRAEQGYPPIHAIGWAEKPYYDKTNKVLHWAKELKFGDEAQNTLNYEVRVLGRKGVLSLTAISTMSELPLVNANIDEVLKMPEFTAGNAYKDFNPGTDKVAEYTIGALVAGGILAKTGVLALIAKFFIAAWKFILLGIAAAWGFIKKLFKKKTPEEAAIPETISEPTAPSE